MLSLRIKYYLLFIISAFATAVQAKENFSLKFKDSAIATADGLVLYNNLHVTNTGSDSMLLHIDFATPRGWKSLSGASIEVSLAPNETQTLPLNLICGKSVPATWQKVQLSAWTTNKENPVVYNYNIKAAERPSHKVQSLTEEIYLEERPDEIKLGVYIKNTGNVADVYALHYDNPAFEIDKKISIALQPGKDTTYYYTVKCNKKQWKGIYNEIVALRLKDKYSNSSSIFYNISRPRDEMSANRYAFAGPTLTVEGGGFVNGDLVNYYGGLRGSYEFGKHHLDFYYQSRMLSNNNYLNNVQRDIYMLNYRYKNFIFKTGTFSQQYNFLVFGNSVSVGYQNDLTGTAFILSGTKRNKNFIAAQNGDNISALGQYRIGRINFRHIAEANFDDIREVNGYVLANEVSLIKNKGLSLMGKVSGSLETRTRPTPGLEDQHKGYSLGYNFGYEFKHFYINSFVEYFSNDHASYRRGSFLQNHSIDWRIDKKHTVGILYVKNRSQVNNFRDSIYNTDVFTYNSTRYGLQATRTTRKGMSRLSGGMMHQSNVFSSNNIGKYYFGELSVQHNFTQYNSVNVTSFNGFSPGLDTSKGMTWIGSHTLGYFSRNFGVNGVYTRTVAIDESTKGVQTMAVSPYTRFTVFDKTTTFNFFLNVAKTTTDKYIRSGVGTGITFNHKYTGTRATLNGYLPFSTYTSANVPVQELRYANFNIAQDIHIPIRQKYYDLKVVLYNDKNNNGLKDSDEDLLRNIPVDINDATLLTNENGEVKYKNLPMGYYSVGVYKAYSVEGLIASNGPEQAINLEKKSATVAIPFKKGRVISGNVVVKQDAANANQISSQYIKVIATDTADRKYTTLTDEDGNFFLYVPEGKFTVSLNPAAFSSSVKATVLSYEVDLDDHENAFVSFELKQKKRKVRFLNQSIAKPEDNDQDNKQDKSTAMN